MVALAKLVWHVGIWSFWRFYPIENERSMCMHVHHKLNWAL